MQYKIVIKGIRLAFIITLLGWLPVIWTVFKGEGASYYLPSFGMLVAAVSLIIGSCRAVILTQGKKWMLNGLAVAVGYLLVGGLLLQALFPIQLGWLQLVNILTLLALSFMGSYLGYLMNKTVFIRGKGSSDKKTKEQNLTKTIS